MVQPTWRWMLRLTRSMTGEIFTLGSKVMGNERCSSLAPHDKAVLSDCSRCCEQGTVKGATDEFRAALALLFGSCVNRVDTGFRQPK